VKSKSQVQVKDGIIKLLEPVKKWVHTLTFDNRREFSNHSQIAEELKAPIKIKAFSLHLGTL